MRSATGRAGKTQGRTPCSLLSHPHRNPNPNLSRPVARLCVPAPRALLLRPCNCVYLHPTYIHTYKYESARALCLLSRAPAVLLSCLLYLPQMLWPRHAQAPARQSRSLYPRLSGYFQTPAPPRPPRRPPRAQRRSGPWYGKLRHHFGFFLTRLFSNFNLRGHVVAGHFRMASLTGVWTNAPKPLAPQAPPGMGR